MITKQSPLELIEFVVLEQHFEFIPSDIAIEDTRALFSKYIVDIDFGIKKMQPDIHQMRVKASINYIDSPESGYKIYLETGGIFKIDEKMKDQETYSNLLYRSTLSMQLNYLRTFIADVSSHFPLGRYWLPSIDLVDLINEKAKQQNAEKMTKKSTKKSNSLGKGK
jgi:preprotein translocase subunit SecB